MCESGTAAAHRSAYPPSPTTREGLLLTRSRGRGGSEAHSDATPAGLLSGAAAALQAALGLSRREARLEAQILAAHALGVARPWLIAHADHPLSPQLTATLDALVARRMTGEPIAYLLGRREFYGLDLAVTPAVLIPRPDTETLVEAALARLPAEHPMRVLDLGTGSGAVALALARHRPRADILAVDRSPEALALAGDNGRRLGLHNVRFVQSDWYARIGVKKFDMIVSNPPYVAAGDPHLARGDLRFEPLSALAAGPDGLQAIRAIVAGAPAHLRAGGWLLFEHGHDQAEVCRTLLATAGFDAPFTLPDLAGRPRVTGGRWPAEPRAS